MARVEYDREIFNIDRLRAAVAWAEIESHKDNPEWEQGVWSTGVVGRVRKPAAINGTPTGDVLTSRETLVEVKCGTGMCIAGWVCAGEGDKFIALEWEDNIFPKAQVSADYAIPKGSREAFGIGERAADLLGITDEEADELFEGFNTIKDIKRIARKIARRRGEVL